MTFKHADPDCRPVLIARRRELVGARGMLSSSAVSL